METVYSDIFLEALWVLGTCWVMDNGQVECAAGGLWEVLWMCFHCEMTLESIDLEVVEHLCCTDFVSQKLYYNITYKLQRETQNIYNNCRNIMIKHIGHEGPDMVWWLRNKMWIMCYDLETRSRSSWVPTFFGTMCTALCLTSGRSTSIL